MKRENQESEKCREDYSTALGISELTNDVSKDTGVL